MKNHCSANKITHLPNYSITQFFQGATSCFLLESKLSKTANSLEVSSMKAPFLLGRLIFGGFFIYNGINHFKQRKELAQYAGAKKVPLPDAAVTATGAAMILGGASILL